MTPPAGGGGTAAVELVPEKLPVAVLPVASGGAPVGWPGQDCPNPRLASTVYCDKSGWCMESPVPHEAWLREMVLLNELAGDLGDASGLNADGDALIAVGDGGIFRFDGFAWSLDQASDSPVVSVAKSPGGVLFAVSEGRLWWLSDPNGSGGLAGAAWQFVEDPAFARPRELRVFGDRVYVGTEVGLWSLDLAAASAGQISDLRRHFLAGYTGSVDVSSILATDSLYLGTNDGVFVLEGDEFVAVEAATPEIDEERGLRAPVAVFDGSLFARTREAVYRRTDGVWTRLLDSSTVRTSAVDANGQLWLFGSRGYRYNGTGFDTPFRGQLDDYIQFEKAPGGALIGVGVSGIVGRIDVRNTPLKVQRKGPARLAAVGVAGDVCAWRRIGGRWHAKGQWLGRTLGGIGLMRRACAGWVPMTSEAPARVYAMSTYTGPEGTTVFAVGEHPAPADPESPEGVVLQLDVPANPTGSQIPVWKSVPLPPGTPKLTQVSTSGHRTAWVGGNDGALFRIENGQPEVMDVADGSGIRYLSAANDTAVVRFGSGLRRTLIWRREDGFQEVDGPYTFGFGVLVTPDERIYAIWGSELFEFESDGVWRRSTTVRSTSSRLRIDDKGNIWGQQLCIGSAVSKTSRRTYEVLVGPDAGGKVHGAVLRW